MHLNILDNEGVLHEPAHGSDDVGYDIIAQDYPEVIGNVYQGPYYSYISHLVYDTKIVAQPELCRLCTDYEFNLMLYPRSSIIKTNLILANSVGVIDPGYRGTIKVCFRYLIQPEDQKIIEGKSSYGKDSKGIVASINPQRIYHEGDKIAQLIPTKINKMTISKQKELTESKRGKDGFGSTGK